MQINTHANQHACSNITHATAAISRMQNTAISRMQHSSNIKHATNSNIMHARAAVSRMQQQISHAICAISHQNHFG